MASESVNRQSVGDVLNMAAQAESDALDAFRGMDASVFRQWAMAASDVAACGAQDCAPESMPNLCGLIYQLIRAADELEEKERKQLKARKAA